MSSKIGQYFTENKELQIKVASLCNNKGAYLEPSAGVGHLVSILEKKVEDITAIELDSTLEKVCTTDIIYQDFFDFIPTNKFSTIFGNPPYLKYRELPKDMKFKMQQGSILSSCNIFYYFIEKCFYLLEDYGELIFIIPREFFNSTRGSALRRLLYNNGTITNVIDYEEQPLFKGAAPNIIIIRYEKNNLSHKTKYELNGETIVKYENLVNSTYIFSENRLQGVKLASYFNIKVGLVTGANEIFEKETKLSINMICSDYYRTKKKRRFIFVDGYSLDEIKNIDRELFYHLLKYKNQLICRKIKKFNETNWYYYGAVRNLEYMRSGDKCIFVNAKTRVDKPFYVDYLDYFDGAVIALIPNCDLDLDKWCDKLNNSKDLFREQGVYVNNRYLFTVKNLQDILIN